MAKDRPLTQREILKAKQDAQASKSTNTKEYLWVLNKTKQSIPIQLRSPIDPQTGKRIDFILGEQTIYLKSGERQRFPKDRLYMNQIQNLQKDRRIKVSKG